MNNHIEGPILGSATWEELKELNEIKRGPRKQRRFESNNMKRAQEGADHLNRDHHGSCGHNPLHRSYFYAC